MIEFNFLPLWIPLFSFKLFFMKITYDLLPSILLKRISIFHLSSLYFHDSSIYSTSVRKSDPLDVLEEGSKIVVVALSLLGSMLLMYSYMIASTDFQSCTKDGESLAITLAHMGLVFIFIGVYYVS